MTRYLLSIDAGRGIIPAAILRELEKVAGPMASFDMVAASGESVITACLMGSGWRADEAYYYFRHHGPLTKRILGRWGKEKANKAPLWDFLASSLTQDLHVPLVVPLYSVNEKRTRILRSWESHYLSLLDLAVAGASMPTKTRPTVLGEDIVFSAEIFVPDPSVILLAEALKMWPEDDFVMLSLGTGTRPYVSRKDLISGGFKEWGENITKMPSSRAEFVMDGLSHHLDLHYFRGEPNLLEDGVLIEETPDNLTSRALACLGTSLRPFIELYVPA